MISKTRKRFYICASVFALSVVSLTAALRFRPVSAAGRFFTPGNLAVSRSVYDGKTLQLVIRFGPLSRASRLPYRGYNAALALSSQPMLVLVQADKFPRIGLK